jgi:monothiol glutaredoxin
MPLEPNVENQIRSWTTENKVFLFMKGNPRFPQCGFSATVIDILEEYDTKVETCNVLENPAVREGIKEYSDWPTIPQLYVSGEFVGGCDIIREMHQNGELASVLGVDRNQVETPSIVLTANAVEAFRDAAQSEEEYPHLRLQIDKQFGYGLSFGPELPGDIEVESNGFSVRMDAQTARRANGMQIDFVTEAGGGGFKIDNPNEPPKVKEITVNELQGLLKSNSVELFDVRGPEEMAVAHVPQARALDQDGLAYLESLDKATAVAFMCHHGTRSLQASNMFLAKGFENVMNVRGGIDAWSTTIDSSVPRY